MSIWVIEWLNWRVLHVDGYREGLELYRQRKVMQLWANVFREAARCGIRATIN